MKKTFDTYLTLAEKLLEKAKHEDYKGYDPYDTLTTTLPLHLFGKWGKVLAIQFQKRFPWNIRPLLGIKKAQNPKAMGLFLQACCTLYKITGNETYKEQAGELFNWLIAHRSTGIKGYGWGYNFEWASPVKVLPAYSPTIVVTGFVAQGIFAYYQISKSRQAVEALEQAIVFIENELPCYQDNSGICISYSTVKKDICYNASMLAAEIYARVYAITRNEQYRNKALEITRFTIQRQHADGSWFYSYDLQSATERKQIDFHQGYILDSILTVMQLCHTDSYREAYQKGLEFYTRHQFSPTGQAYYRLPKKYPVEIHNQTQGIITFNRAATLYPEYYDFVRKILDFTIQQMFNPKTLTFYYKKYPLYTIKTPFIRWSHAWMTVALTEFLTYKKDF